VIPFMISKWWFRLSSLSMLYSNRLSEAGYRHVVSDEQITTRRITKPIKHHDTFPIINLNSNICLLSANRLFLFTVHFSVTASTELDKSLSNNFANHDEHCGFIDLWWHENMRIWIQAERVAVGAKRNTVEHSFGSTHYFCQSVNISNISIRYMMNLRQIRNETVAPFDAVCPKLLFTLFWQSLLFYEYERQEFIKAIRLSSHTIDTQSHPLLQKTLIV
jgi:hypothetical protein